MKRIVLFCLASLSFTVLAAAQTSQQPKETAVTMRTRIYVNGKAIAASKVIVKEGISYVDTATLAEALGASVQLGANRLVVTGPPRPSCEGEKTSLEGLRFSEQFRSDVARVPDEIESLRAVVLKLKKETTAIGPRFDEIDHELWLSQRHVETDADKAVYYALSYANNSLAIVYYKQSRGVPPEELHKDESDSMMCAMESKFALMKGILLPGQSCSVLKRMEAQLPAKPEEATDKPDSDKPDE